MASSSESASPVSEHTSPSGSSTLRSLSNGIRELGHNLSKRLEKLSSVGNGSGAFQNHNPTDEESLVWATLEKLPTYDRLRTTVRQNTKDMRFSSLDVSKLTTKESECAVNRIIGSNVIEDNKKFLTKLRRRIDRVGIELPTVELRYEHLTVTATVHTGSRALPTLWNAAKNFTEALLMFARANSDKSLLTILDDVSGIIKPGRMTLLLGPPLCGKTTLLQALANRLAKSVKVEGKVTYNGYGFDEFVPQKTATYVGQNDLHQPELTVRETLSFSARCQGIGSRHDLIAELCKREKELGLCPDPDVDMYLKATAVEGEESDFSTEYIMKILGLDVCANTFVGDGMTRGVSGGQKKRVTTGELIVGPARVLLMDQISDGLDSSTTFQIISCLGQLAQHLKFTIVIALLQPAPETFDLFDDILLLSEGQVAYHGPRTEATTFFESLGFVCPPRKSVSDYIQELTSRKDQEQYWADKSKPYSYLTVKEVAAAFTRYHIGDQLRSCLEVPYDKLSCHKAALAFNKRPLSAKQITATFLKREYLLMKRNYITFLFRAYQVVSIGLLSMAMFIKPRMHRRNIGDAQMFNSAQFFGLGLVMFNGYVDLAYTVTRLPVFFKQRELYLFPGWVYAVAAFLLGTPVTLFEVSLWSFITYYPQGYAPFIGRFFRNVLVLLLIHTTAGGLFRAIAGICRSMVISNTGGSTVLLLIYILGGFILSRDNMKDFWVWGYWTSPLAYANNAVSLNEFLSHQWKKYAPGGSRWIGLDYLHTVSLFSRGHLYWVAVLALLMYIILFNVAFAAFLQFLSPLGKPQAVIAQDVQKQASQDKERLTKSFSASEKTLAVDDPNTRHEEELREKHGMILPFHPYVMTFANLSYFVDMPPAMKTAGGPNKLQLLHDMTGALRPGVLTALVGATGAGKTTLLDVLSGKKTGGYIEGDIRISGFPKKQDTFARIAGYCEQTDIHSPQVTVLESLTYSAWLRLPNEIADVQRQSFVREVMDLVELTGLRDALVGLPGQTGLSTDQRKRLTIGVELVANPSIIFMDEPTTGLDARAAAIVMRTVRNTVDTGRTVVCTIHQPSIQIFEAFDELLLMKRGGYLIYAGHLGKWSRDLIEYFETMVPGVRKYEDGKNPATWMLEITTPAAEQALGVDFAEIYTKSPLYLKNKTMIEELSNPAPDAKDIEFPTKYSRPWKKQFTSCLWKHSLTYWRSPDYVNVRILFTVITAVVMGSVFWRLGHKRNTQINLNSVLGALYAEVIFIGVTNAQTVQPLVFNERPAYYRERAAGMYSALPYTLAQVFTESYLTLIQAVIFSFISYPMFDFEWSASKVFWSIYFRYILYITFTFLGMMTTALTSTPVLGNILGAMWYHIVNLFSGFVIPKSKMPPYLSWIYWTTPTANALYGLVTSQYGDLHGPDHILKTLDGRRISVAKFLEDYYGFKHGFVGGVAAIATILPVVFATGFTFGMAKLNFQNR